MRNPDNIRAEPIAIIGMGCRFPRAEDLDAFWQLLKAGESAVAEVSPESAPERHSVFRHDPIEHDALRRFALVSGIDEFDAEFFRMAPLEAEFLDPQQRMLLETSWTALEDAGIAPHRLRGSSTGVFVGLSSNDYGEIIPRARGSVPNLYSITGNLFSTASGRIAYLLGLKGPAVTSDTACSSSLVAVHQAVTALQQGDTDIALAGGATAILALRALSAFAGAGMVSPSGRCWTFDEAADGFVRGEGCGVLVLKRLAEARASGDRIWAVIRGSAVNQDGASEGLWVPNGPSQERVIQEALDRANLAPADIHYLEAHGTGTKVGDPTELSAASAVYGRGREADRPLLIGSVKTNIGHLSAAAGIAGLIKVALAMNRGLIPKHLNFRNPTSLVDWKALPVRVTSESTDWPLSRGQPARAGVNSFGLSGTNAHVIVESDRTGGGDGSSDAGWPVGEGCAVAGPPSDLLAGIPPSTRLPEMRRIRLMPLSAKSDSALRELAKRYLSWLENQAGDQFKNRASEESWLADLAWTAGVGRDHFACRAGIPFRDEASLRRRLEAFVRSPGPARAGVAKRVAFLYTGQASQWAGMGKELYDREPVVRAVLDRCDRLLRADRKTSLLDIMFGRAGLTELDDPVWTQPAIYSLECALTALWSSIGVRPDAVIGHSLGELAAAEAAGVFTLEDGLRFAAARGRAFGRLPATGAMAAVFAPLDEVSVVVDEYNSCSPGPELSIAAENGMHQVVSGRAVDVEAISKRFEDEGRQLRRLHTTQGYHSPLVEPALEDLGRVIDVLPVASPSVDLVSNVTGRVVAVGEALDGMYWRRHAREAVAFARGVQELARLGVEVLVEVGPHAVLGPMSTLAWPETAGAATQPVVVSSLQRPSRKNPDVAMEGDEAFMTAVAGAYSAGLDIEFDGLFHGEVRRRISLPGYAFQRKRHWIEASKRVPPPSGGHSLLGIRHESPTGEIRFESHIGGGDPKWLSDHLVFGQVVVPGATYGAMAVSALLTEEAGPVVLEEMQLHAPLVLPGDGGDVSRRVEVVLGPSRDGRGRSVAIYSRGDDEDGWVKHAAGRLRAGAPAPGNRSQPELEDLRATMSRLEVRSLYRTKTRKGIELGPSFRVLAGVWAVAGESLAEVVLPSSLARSGLEVHPVLIDGCFQSMLAARDAEVDGAGTYLPFGWDRMWIAGALPDRVVCHVRMRDTGPATAGERLGDEPREVFKADLHLHGSDGSTVGVVEGFTIKRATRAAMLSAVEGPDDMLYEVVWTERPEVTGMRSADFLPSSEAVAAGAKPLAVYLAREGVEPAARTALLEDLEWLARGYALHALEELGWQRRKGEVVDPSELQQRLQALTNHSRLWERIFGLLKDGGVLATGANADLVVAVDKSDPPPHESFADPEAFAARLRKRHPSGVNELVLLGRCGRGLGGVLRGRGDPLELLFGGEGGGASDHYRNAPASIAANKLLRDALAALLSELPEGRRIRVLEVGAGTGATTEWVLKQLPQGSFDYCYTDISAGFFSDPERRFGRDNAGMEYRALDIEGDPLDQGFDAHGYDIVIAANVLHATRDLGASLGHCRALLAPSGYLLAIEGLCRRGWLDLSFGQLDGWWRFDDRYRPDYPLAEPATWQQALWDGGFTDAHLLGAGKPGEQDLWDRAVIVARQAAQVAEPPGVWVLAADRGVIAAELAKRLAARGQIVLLAGSKVQQAQGVGSGPGVTATFVDAGARESWRSLLGGLPRDLPLRGVVHLTAVHGHGPESSTEELAADVRRMAASALALTQGLLDTGLSPSQGMWIVTRGGQLLERERDGQVAGSTLWGFGKVVAGEAPHLKPRMLDLDPAGPPFPDCVLDELLYPDTETHIAYRAGQRHVARLVRASAGTPRLQLPEGLQWRISHDPDGATDTLCVENAPPRSPGPGEVRVAVDAAGLNFSDVMPSVGAIDSGLPGSELCGRIVATGAEVTEFAPGDRIVGVASGTLTPELVTRAELVARVPEHLAASGAATVPLAFLTVALCFEFAGLSRDDRVLIHAGAGGVGLAAIQWVRAAGAEALATASDSKRDFLRSLGVRHVFDSRDADLAAAVLEATGGDGVDVVVNSLSGPGFIEAGLSCLATGGRFVEMGKRNIWSKARMRRERPDVAYEILAPDATRDDHAARMGTALRQVVDRLVAGELSPLTHTRWPMAEAGRAMDFIRRAKHIGKVVLTTPPLARGCLREDRTYLVTGGLGGIGCAVAEWLAERGAGTIVLNGRRPPGSAAEQVVRDLRQRGAKVVVELADVTDPVAVDAMLERMGAVLPPIAGVIHSVGLLSDGSLSNQSWESLRRVMWPKVLGAWHLHRATRDMDLDLFVLFSSMAGVLGNAGQANHAAANAFLDQLAAHRRAMGLAGQSIQWGAWSGLGEAEEQRERIARKLEARGTGWISPRQGIKTFEQLVRRDSSTAAVTVVDWPVYGQTLNTPPPLLEHLLSRSRPPSPVDGETSRDLLAALRRAPPGDLRKKLSKVLRREIRSVLRLPSEPDPAVAFFDLGMDSLMAVELRNRVNRAFNGIVTLSNTAIFDHPNVTSLTSHIHTLLEAVPDGETEATESAPSPPLRQTHDDPPEPGPLVAVARKRAAKAPGRRASKGDGRERIAVVGMACRFPSAPDLSAFWRLLESGGSAVTDRRLDSDYLRGSLRDGVNGDVCDRRAAFVEGLDGFDADFFGIVPNAADTMDPECRLLLETGWRAIEDAGIDPARLQGSRTGIYVGVGFGEYRDLLSSVGAETGCPGTAGGAAVGRIAALLGVEGPTLAIDAAGASSLVAVHRACSDLRTGEATLALVGAANTVLSPIVARTMRRFGNISRAGRSSVFDASADGFVRGEGCGVVLLKRLDDARADGDRIWGVIRGTAVANSGACTELTLPGEAAQRRAIEEALSRAGVAASAVDYLEANGTGSALTDPIEIRAAAEVFGRERDARRPLLVGSVKTNIGHLEEASGMAGLIKVLLAMTHGSIPAHINFHTPTPRLDWDRLPVRVTAVQTEWPEASNRPARAGVSAFGKSGSSAHVVLEQHASSNGNDAGSGTVTSPTGLPRRVAITSPPTEPEGLSHLSPTEEAPVGRKARVLPLSARSSAALRDLARSYLSFLDDQVGNGSVGEVETTIQLADMAWTAGVGRGHMSHRAGIVFDGLAPLRSGLRGVVEADSATKPAASGRVAFHYTGSAGLRAELGRELHDCEPVARAVMNRCDEVWRRLEGTSLVEAILGGRSARRAWEHPATYMLECALTTLWSSVGIRPAVVVGDGIGELAAARTAGVFRLEQGLRMAWALGSFETAGSIPGDPEGAFDRADPLSDAYAPAAPSLALVSGSTGRLVETGEELDRAYWRSLILDTGASREWVDTLANRGVDRIIEIGPQPPVETGNSSFAAAVADAYEAGLPVSFAGLFTGETRRRVALPGYPFQRRSCWIQSSRDGMPVTGSS